MSNPLHIDDTTLQNMRSVDPIEMFTIKYGDTIRKVAKREHKGASTVTREDLEQDLFVFFYKRINSVAGFSDQGVEGLAVKAARAIMLQERLDYMHFSGQFIYTPAMVETYLEDSVWAELVDVPDIDGRVDVRAEFDLLPHNKKVLLFRKYGAGESFDKSTAEGKMIDRAVVEICNRLNLSARQTRVPLDATS